VLGVLGVEDIAESKNQGPCPDGICILVDRDNNLHVKEKKIGLDTFLLWKSTIVPGMF